MLSILEALGQRSGREYAGGTDICVCSKCGKEVFHERGIPCNEKECPECKTPMTGKNVGE